jgi:lysophospholipase L1-like esterase
MLNVPHRNDLAPNSCVNYEVKGFERKPGRQRKVHKNLSVTTVNLDRDLYTWHGFHLNVKGKEQTANRIASVIKDVPCK